MHVSVPGQGNSLLPDAEESLCYPCRLQARVRHMSSAAKLSLSMNLLSPSNLRQAPGRLSTLISCQPGRLLCRYPSSAKVEQLINLESLLPNGQKKIPKVYQIACHPLQPHLVAVAANAGESSFPLAMLLSDKGGSVQRVPTSCALTLCLPQQVTSDLLCSCFRLTFSPELLLLLLLQPCFQVLLLLCLALQLSAQHAVPVALLPRYVSKEKQQHLLLLACIVLPVTHMTTCRLCATVL